MLLTPPAHSVGQPARVHTLNLTWSPPSGIIGLSFVNYFLRIITLGIYHFWGKTEVRRRIWSSIRLNGEPLHYTGTGRELFVGFLIVFGVVLLPVFAASIASALVFGPQSAMAFIVQALTYLLVFALIGFGIWRAMRYRLSRTHWRGIRAGLEGSQGRYAWTYIWTAILNPFTLGWLTPWRTTKLQSLMVSDMRFGDRPLRFTAGSGPLYARFAGLWLGAIVLYGGMFGTLAALFYPKILAAHASGHPPAITTVDYFTIVAVIFISLLLLGIIGAWYKARVMNHFAAHTHFEGATFRGTATARGLIWLAISNFLISMLSLGILVPIAQMRSARYQVENLKIDGAVPLAEIAQGAAAAGKYGEGLAQAFDFDAF